VSAGPRRVLRALLVDFDGVLRHYDPAVATRLELRYGLAPGVLLETLLAPDLVRAASLGELTSAQWQATVAEKLGAPEAVREWAGYRGEVQPEVLGFVREVRAAAVPVALATNATDSLDADLAHLGLAGEFDAVVNSAVLRVAKPAPEYFRLACRALGTVPADCLFVDDLDRNVRGARAVGLCAHRWSGPGDLDYLRAALGVQAPGDRA
jgi:putative hydrolase of the HAD superfamily